MLVPKPVRSVVSRVGTTGLRGRLALDTTDLTGYPIQPMNDPKVTMLGLLQPLAKVAGHCLWPLSLVTVAGY